jgi:hypothetical protein
MVGLHNKARAYDGLMAALKREVEKLRREAAAERLITPAQTLIEGWADDLQILIDQYGGGQQ